jgi:hypothetical protein
MAGGKIIPIIDSAVEAGDQAVRDEHAELAAMTNAIDAQIAALEHKIDLKIAQLIAKRDEEEGATPS